MLEETGENIKLLEPGVFLVTVISFPENKVLPAVEIVSLAPGHPVHDTTKAETSSEF